MSSAQATNPCSRRLTKELISLQREPLQYVGVNQVTNRLWHVNVFSPTAQTDLAVPFLHLHIQFPESYPLEPPEIFVAHEYGHVNVDQVLQPNHRYKICLDMLALNSETMSKYSAWSPAFTMRGLLVQLQSTTMDTSLLTVTHNHTVQQCADSCRQFTCSACNHTFDAPNPAPGMVLIHDRGTVVQEQECFQMPSIVRVHVFENASNNRSSKKGGAFKKKVLVSTNPSTPSIPSSKSSTSSPSSPSSPSSDGGWTVVSSSSTQSSASAMKFKRKDTTTKTDGLQVSTAAITTASPTARGFHVLRHANSLVSRGTIKVTKASLKNQRRRRRKKEEAEASNHKREEKVEEGKHEEATTTTEEEVSEMSALVVVPASSPQDRRRLCPLEIFPSHLLVKLLSYTNSADVQALACTSSNLQRMATDGWMWRNLFHRTKQSSTLAVKDASDWRRLFDLHLTTCVASSLKCFYTQDTFEDDILGVPLDFTRNPRTGLSDYVSVSSDSILSKTAWHVHGVKRTAWNEPAQCWLPLYISEDHFQRALPSIQRTIAQVAGHAGYSLKSTDAFHPLQVLEVIPQCYKTLALLLATKADAVCSGIADTFVQLHRLFVALIQEYPVLRYEIRNRLKSFIRGGSHERSKETVPSLGELYPYLSVCPEFKFEDLVRPYFLEQLDRGVLWRFREHPELAKRSRVVSPSADQELLDKSFISNKVSQRLLLLNRAILNLLRPSASPSIADTCARHDYLLGHARPAAKRAFISSVHAALNITGWGDFLMLSGIRMNSGELPSPVTLSNWLKKSADNSEKRGYHKRGMNFNKVHRSGGSRLLKRGEGQDLGAVSNIKLSDSWRWEQEQMFLDASVLTFDFCGKHRATLDYSRTRARGMIHSGDVMDHSNCKGKHTVTIELRRLDRSVQSCVVVLSAFDEATMEKALQPNVAVYDEESKSELCRYELDAKSSVLQGMKHVVMCRVWRQEVGAAWRVDAVGSIGAFGDATNYEPIIRSLEATYKVEKPPAKKWERGLKVEKENKQ